MLARSSNRNTKVALGGGVVVLAVIALLIGRSLFRASANDPSPSSDGPNGISSPSGQPVGSATSSGSASGAAATTSGAPAVAPKGGFAIKIGDKIDEGVPGAGAGDIETPGAKDVYAFNAAPGQRVYFRRLKHGKDMEQIAWTLTDPDGAEVFDSRLCTEPGVQLLRKGGTYTLTVGSDRVPATGPYTLQLFNVPPPQQFAITVGAPIREDVPGPGAGNIESPGVKDVYTFAAAPGQTVYLRNFEHGKDMEQVSWTLADADGMEVFDSRLYTEPGVQRLRRGGTYTLTVGSDRVPTAGTYRLQLFNVPPPQQFAIKVGDTIKESTPGAGAGTIESPGAKDIYTFTTPPGQRVYFRKLQHDDGMEQNHVETGGLRWHEGLRQPLVHGARRTGLEKGRDVHVDGRFGSGSRDGRVSAAAFANQLMNLSTPDFTSTYIEHDTPATEPPRIQWTVFSEPSISTVKSVAARVRSARGPGGSPRSSRSAALPQRQITTTRAPQRIRGQDRRAIHAGSLT